MSLSTHVLDAVHGAPAEGMKIELWKIESEENRNLIRNVVTNHDGRIDRPLLDEVETEIGEYELVFYVSAYFQEKDVVVSNPPFLSKVPIRFTIANAKEHYHVPLLVTPWSYSTYRGS